MKRWAIRTAGVAVAAAAGLAMTALPASAGNSDPKAPRESPERVTFCANTAWWFPGFQMKGTTNDGSYGTWVINSIQDDPHQTAFNATFAGSWSVTWYC
jgi:hypothetical protein